MLDGLPAGRATGEAQHRIVGAGVPIDRDLQQAAGTLVGTQCIVSLADAIACAKLCNK